MDPQEGGGPAAAVAPPPYLLAALPELSQPPLLLTMPELEAVAAALPGKKRRLWETFERLAATSPDPLPFRWEDLDAYLSPFQYPVTLRSCQPQVPLATPVPAAHPITAEEDVLVDKGKKRKASSLACLLDNMAGNCTGSLCPAPLGCGDDNTTEAHVSTMLLDPVSKIAVVRPEQSGCPSNAAASLVQQASATNPASRQPRPPRWDVPAVVATGNVEKAKKLTVERNVKKVSTPPADGVGNEALANIEADMPADRPVCEISAVEHEVPAVVTGGASLAATNIRPALALEDSCASLSLTLKLESCVEATDVDKNVVVVAADEKINKAIEADNALPLQVEGQEAYEVSPLPLSISSNAFAEACLESGRNTCVQQNSAAIVPKLLPDDCPETAEPLQAKGPDASHVLQQQHMSDGCSEPVSQVEKRSKLSLRNHGGRPTVGINIMRKAQEAFQRRTKENRLCKVGIGQDNRPGDGKAKPNRVISGDSKNSNKFCYKCGSKGHVTHKCRTEKHLVELYAKHKKEKEANKICYRCGTKGHMASKCRTPKHLVDLYQNHRAVQKKASLRAGASHSSTD